jgi:putative endopeptidase
MIALDGKSSEVDIPIIDWEEFKIVGKQSYIVNAYYTPTENSIYVPLAYLQKPFIDLDERGIEYNLAHIGYTLGHEMSHCLDDLGSKYNEHGNLKNWWTKHDRRVFDGKVKNVIFMIVTRKIVLNHYY